MDAFESIFGDSSKVNGTVRHKLADGTVRTAKLTRGPADMSEQAFSDAAVYGVNFSEKTGDKERSRSRSRKDVTGAAARSAVNSMLGFTPTDVPDKVRARGRQVQPSANGDAAAT